MENKNPLEKVRFYTKDQLDVPIRLAKDQVSYVLPDVFQECSIRLYCNIKNKEKDDIVESITKAFGHWCQEKGYPLPQDKHHQTKPKTRASNELEESETQGILYERTHSPEPASNELEGPETQRRSDEPVPIPLPEPASGQTSLDQPLSYDGEGIDVRSQTTDQ
ncbi:uncharacterized protein LOC132727965 [Ruditapes philippinarum]|uniref:uncharacterized protein LOC132727965 n=1 Tax=Ruditapes philippinarum TaxID=129788 RepID=UPI00295B2E95|nr:uncharacterized protein LOC132727965 [Ruditapes philippinarum]